jgi:hypothetical protein
MAKWTFYCWLFFFTSCNPQKTNPPIWCDIYFRILEQENLYKTEITFLSVSDNSRISLNQHPLKKVHLPVGGTKFLLSESYNNAEQFHLKIDEQISLNLIPVTIESILLPDTMHTWEDFQISVLPEITENEEIWLVLSNASNESITLRYKGNPLTITHPFPESPSPGVWSVQPIRKKISAIEEPSLLGQLTSEYYSKTHSVKFLYLQSISTKH